MVVRIAIDTIVVLCYKLRIVGVTLDEQSDVMCDNK